MTYRILVTGSRAWADYDKLSKALTIQATEAIRSGLDVIIVHGACPTGADAMAQKFADLNGLKCEAYHADWSLGKRAGPMRNQEMINTGPDICIAFPVAGGRGTLDCMTRAKKAGITVVNLGV